MEKYIIDLNEDWIDGEYLRLPARIAGTLQWIKTKTALIPYTEPDLDAIRKEAYQQGHKDGYNKHDTERIRKQGYDKGLDDLGNALRLLLFQYSNYTLQEIFGYDTARAVVEHFEGSEIVARIRCYEGGVKQDVETIRKEAYSKGYDTAKHECEDCMKSRAKVEQELADKAYQNGMKDGMEKSREAIKNLSEQNRKDFEDMYDSGYGEGLKDAWEAAQKIWEHSEKELYDIFGYYMRFDVFTKTSASEAIEKIRQYEQKQDESEESKKELSVTTEEVMRQYLDTFCNKKRCEVCPLDTSDFTCGRGYHFLTKSRVSDEEIRRAYATVLQKMKEN